MLLFIHYWNKFLCSIGAYFYSLSKHISIHYCWLQVMRHHKLLKISWWPCTALSAASTAIAMVLAFHLVAAPATTPLPSPSPMATMAPSPCGSNLASRLGHSKVYVHFIFYFYASWTNRVSKQPLVFAWTRMFAMQSRGSSCFLSHSCYAMF